MGSYYDILRVNEDDDEDAITTAYRIESKKYHPDRKGGSQDKFTLVAEAYAVLSNKDLRREYDRLCKPDYDDEHWRCKLERFNADDNKRFQDRTEQQYTHEPKQKTWRDRASQGKGNTSWKPNSNKNKKRSPPPRQKPDHLVAQAVWDKDVDLVSQFELYINAILSGASLMFNGDTAVEPLPTSCGNCDEDFEPDLKTAFLQSYRRDGIIEINVSSQPLLIGCRATRVLIHLTKEEDVRSLGWDEIAIDSSSESGLIRIINNNPGKKIIPPELSLQIIDLRQFALLVDPVSVAMLETSSENKLSRLLTTLLNISMQHPCGVTSLAYGKNDTLKFHPESRVCIERLLAGPFYSFNPKDQLIIRNFSILLADLRLKQNQLLLPGTSEELQRRLKIEIQDIERILTELTNQEGREKLSDPVLRLIMEGNCHEPHSQERCLKNKEQRYGEKREEVLAVVLSALAKIDAGNPDGIISIDFGVSISGQESSRQNRLPVFLVTSGRCIDNLLSSPTCTLLSDRCKEVTTGLCLMLRGLRHARVEIAQSTALKPEEKDKLIALVDGEHSRVHTFMCDAKKVNSIDGRKEFVEKSQQSLAKIADNTPTQRLSLKRLFLTALSLITGVGIVVIPFIACTSGIRATLFKPVDTYGISAGISCSREGSEKIVRINQPAQS